ncbi:MAG TPA: hypothetical protein VHN37_13780 [Actinomycetota bacterium]|nr:hypothetical protein [Actinomycetota bacterium]
MADNPTRPAARLGAALAVLVALVAVPFRPTVAATPAVPDALAQWADEGDERFLYWAQRNSDAAAQMLQQLDPGGRFILNFPWGDMTGDRLADVLVVEIDTGPGGLGLAGFSTTLRGLDGRTGDSMWSREFDAQVVFPDEVRLGKKARAGVLVVSRDFERDVTTFLALDGRGRRAYRHDFAASTNVDGGQVTGRQDVVAYHVQNSHRGAATDVLVGIADVRRTPQVHPAVPSIVGLTRTNVVDGRTGELVAHPDPEIGVGRVPMPLPAGDLDGDGLDDHVMTYVVPDLESDEESGLPQLPALDGELVRGRRGVDGARLWTSTPMELDDGWESPPLQTHTTLGDQTRDGHDEVLLSYDRSPYISLSYDLVYPPSDQKGVWSLSGRNGDVLWHRPATAAQVVGDLDRDRKRDVLLVDDVNGGRRSGTRITGASGLDARRVYSRFLPIRRDDDSTVESDVWRVGDLQPDGVTELFVDQSRRRELDGGMEWAWEARTLVSGKTGARLPRALDFSPVMASADGRGDDLFRVSMRSEGSKVVVDGRTRKLLLDVAFDIPLTLPTDYDYLWAMPARLDRDRCVDFVGTLMNSRSTFALAFDGGSGRLLWAKRQQGIDVGGPIRQTRRIDSNTAC